MLSGGEDNDISLKMPMSVLGKGNYQSPIGHSLNSKKVNFSRVGILPVYLRIKDWPKGHGVNG